MSTSVAILIDTNILIPSEPQVGTDVPLNMALATEFCRHAHNTPCHLYYHPAVKHDINRDKEADRAQLLSEAIKRYNAIPNPPGSDILPEDVIGTPELYSNAWVDNQLLAAVSGNAVRFLVTEDKGIHKKAARLGLAPRVLNLSDALRLTRTLFDRDVPPPPSVKCVKAHEISLIDPIFDSLRADYSGFDNWFEEKCQQAQRDVYVIYSESSEQLAAICILKPENQVELGPSGKTLKLCTFKVAEEGSLFGELLLKAVFDYVFSNAYEYTYLTAFAEKQQRLIAFAQTFGFDLLPETNKNGESIVYKRLIPQVGDDKRLSPFEFHITYGPPAICFKGNNSFIIPIEPQWHKMLFPEFEPNAYLLPPRTPCGNSIKKIYLSYSAITQLQQGDSVAFYRSADYKGVTALGIVESTLRSQEPDEIIAFAALRTVYSHEEICDLCQNKAIFAIKFRLVWLFNKKLSFSELMAAGALQGQPQSIQGLNENAVEMIQHRFSEERHFA